MTEKNRQTGNTSDNDTPLSFRVSSGLKTLIGKELIVDDFIAVFELIKNAFDAHATLVKVILERDSLIIADNGKGMSLSDLQDKWLFVAYSAKVDGSEDKRLAKDYRDALSQRPHYAGAKGVGRFSCDRLGTHLRLLTREARKGAQAYAINIAWPDFERDPHQLFADIKLQYDLVDSLGHDLDHGTVLEITNLSSQWDRNRILTLKGSLSKLISPVEDPNGREFQIQIEADSERAKDEEILETARENGLEAIQYERSIVNGYVRNFIFQTLDIKTTSIHTTVSDDARTITTELADRGELIYRIREPNPFPELAKITFTLYYLNRAAKLNFAKLMGVSTTKFGSIFLYKNGFRIQPYGDPEDDSFGFDKRRAQGHSRYLGNRDLFGRIDIYSDNPGFRETTSRDGGLITTRAYIQLTECLYEKCFSRLEKYVVGVQWPERLDKDLEDISLIQTPGPRSRIITLLRRLTDSDDVEVLDYSHNLIDVLSTKDEEFSESLVALESIASKLGNTELLNRIAEAEKRYQSMRTAEEEARALAEKERKAREDAEQRAAIARREARKFQQEQRETATALEEEKKRNLFLTANSNADLDTVINLHHQISICSSTIDKHLKLLTLKASKGKSISPQELTDLVDRISLANKKIQTITRFATKANFRLDAAEITEDLPTFIEQYLLNVCAVYTGPGFTIAVENKAGENVKKAFRPLEMTMAIDNIVSNARKANANRLDVTISLREKKVLDIIFCDNGDGLNPAVKDRSRLFEKGFTTTRGSGLGLYHVKDILGRMGGLVGIESTDKKGFCIYMRLAV
jgi:signal transduction histidine kinase